MSTSKLGRRGLHRYLLGLLLTVTAGGLLWKWEKVWRVASAVVSWVVAYVSLRQSPAPSAYAWDIPCLFSGLSAVSYCKKIFPKFWLSDWSIYYLGTLQRCKEKLEFLSVLLWNLSFHITSRLWFVFHIYKHTVCYIAFFLTYMFILVFQSLFSNSFHVHTWQR